MVTREELENFLAMKRELSDLRHRAAAALARARESKRAADRECAYREAAVYDAAAMALEEQRMRIEAAIMAVRNPDMRLALRMRYMDGRGDLEIARRLNYSDRHIRRIIESAIDEMERAEE